MGERVGVSMHFYKFPLLFSALLLIGLGCARPAPSTEPTASTAPSGPVIEFRDGTFNPRELRISRGTTVTFKNVGSRPVWPASDVHPVHLGCPGFDPRRSLAGGASWSYTFTEVKTCPYHNHLSATEIGRIVVE